jgi:hypothetical protein
MDGPSLRGLVLAGVSGNALVTPHQCRTERMIHLALQQRKETQAIPHRPNLALGSIPLPKGPQGTGVYLSVSS